MAELTVNPLSEKTEYKVFIDNDPIENLKSKIMSLAGDNYAVVISEKVYKLYGKILNFDKDFTYILKDGEKQKSLKTYVKILKFLFKKGMTRKSTLIAVGGGVCGDITGFAASTFMRGISFIQIPTTLLAAVDSSVGGKTAVNTDYGKNLVGTFYQPKAVFVNTNFLDTLDENQYKSGLGEVLKYGFIERSCGCQENYELLDKLYNSNDMILNRDKNLISEIIEICLRLKISVVNADEKESGLRRILNFGHTWGHAIEKLMNYKKTHGECVVEGMRYAFKEAEKQGLADENYTKYCLNLIDKYGYKKMPPFKPEILKKQMKTDKKSDKNWNYIILPNNHATVTIRKIEKT